MIRSDVVVYGGDLAIEGVARLVDVRERVRVRTVAAVARRSEMEEAGCEGKA